jgi:predicted TIM-barrel fold metal-dependent hydrolase
MDRKMITSDCHVALPYSLFDELPDAYREHFPRIVDRADGRYLQHPRMPARMAAMMGGSTDGFKLPDGDAALARNAWGNVCPEAAPSFDPAAMLAELAQDGVHGAVLIGEAGHLAAGVPTEAQIAFCEIANDHAATTWGPYLDRVAPGILLPFDDIPASVRELERAAAMGLRPALMPEAIEDLPYYSPEWEPLWEAACALQVPITMHVGGRRFAQGRTTGVADAMLTPSPGKGEIGFYTSSVMMGDTLGWFVFGGVFDKYPDLHIVMTEGYAGWLAFAMQMFDHHTQQSRFSAIAGMMGSTKLEAPPSFYLKRQAHATFMWDPLAVLAREITGLDCLLWGNDYPHFEGSFPFSGEWNDKQFADLSEAEIDQLVRGNAARIFRIEV